MKKSLLIHPVWQKFLGKEPLLMGCNYQGSHRMLKMYMYCTSRCMIWLMAVSWKFMCERKMKKTLFDNTLYIPWNLRTHFSVTKTCGNPLHCVRLGIYVIWVCAIGLLILTSFVWESLIAQIDVIGKIIVFLHLHINNCKTINVCIFEQYFILHL